MDVITERRRARRRPRIPGTTTRIEDGQVATVNGNNYTGTVTGGVFVTVCRPPRSRCSPIPPPYVATASSPTPPANAATRIPGTSTPPRFPPRRTLDEIAMTSTSPPPSAAPTSSSPAPPPAPSRARSATVLNGNNYTGMKPQDFSVTLPQPLQRCCAVPAPTSPPLPFRRRQRRDPDIEEHPRHRYHRRHHRARQMAIHVITAAERGADLVISGTTTGIENGQVATVSSTATTTPAPSPAGFSASPCPAAGGAALLANCTTYVATASVSDAAGNAATPDGAGRPTCHRYHRRHRRARRDQQ